MDAKQVGNDGELVFCGSDEAGSVHLHGYDVGGESVDWIVPGGDREATAAELSAIWGDEVPTRPTSRNREMVAKWL